MPIQNQTDICQTLSQFNGQFRDIAINAWDKWSKHPEKNALYRRTRATLIHNWMVNDALEQLRNMDGVSSIERHESALFLIKDSVLVRFKKGSGKGLSRNYPTQSAIDFNDPQAELFQFPDVSRIDIVYVLNTYETLIEDVLIVARAKSKILWSYSIYTDVDGSASIVPFSPLPNNPPPADANMRIAGENQKDEIIKEK